MRIALVSAAMYQIHKSVYIKPEQINHAIEQPFFQNIHK